MDFTKGALIRLFWFFAGIITYIMVIDHEDEQLIRSGKKPVNRSIEYHKINNPEYFAN